MHVQTRNVTSKIIPTDQWKARRQDIADAGGTLAVVTGSFALLQPGNLAAIQEAARQASHVCVIVHPDNPSAPIAYRDTARPGTAGRLELTAALRAVSMATTCSPMNAEAVIAQLRPFTLVDCMMQKARCEITAAARKLAKNIVDLAPIAACFTPDIQEAIRDARTPIAIPENAMPPLPDRHDLDRFLASGASVRPLVTVNGCFDLLHLGHVRLLAQARTLGARLLVLVNDDTSVRQYKGSKRPIFPIPFRLHALNGFRAVAMAYPFSGDNPLSLLGTIRPDIHVKGGSFDEARVREEKRLLESWGGRLEIIPLVEGFSTTNMVNQMTDTEQANIQHRTSNAQDRREERTPEGNA